MLRNAARPDDIEEDDKNEHGGGLENCGGWRDWLDGVTEADSRVRFGGVNKREATVEFTPIDDDSDGKEEDICKTIETACKRRKLNSETRK